MTKTVSSAVLTAMKDNNQFRSQGYSLHKDFTGEHQVIDVREYKTRNAGEDDDANAFRVNCKSASGNHSINGFMFMNAYILPKSEELKDIKPVKDGVKDVYFYDEMQEALRSAKYVNSLHEDGSFDLPEKFEIIGAVVSKDARGDHPYIPLRRYPMYSVILRHHQKIDPEATYVDRDTIDMYLAADEIQNLPKGFKFELPKHETKAWEMGMWNPTLIIRDWEDA